MQVDSAAESGVRRVGILLFLSRAQGAVFRGDHGALEIASAWFSFVSIIPATKGSLAGPPQPDVVVREGA